MNEFCYSDPGIVIIDVRDLEDGLNEPGVIWRKVGAALCALSLGNKVAIRCHAGISRSNAIAAAVLAIRENRSYNQALEIMRERIPTAQPNEEIVEAVQTALNTHVWKAKGPNHKHNFKKQAPR
jgi:protein-tyrosine phosphatase